MKLRFLIPILLALAPAASAQNTPAQRILYVTSDPAGACSVAAALRYNTLNGKLWGCDNGTWTEVGGSASSVAWGSITGTLSSQSDLNTALGAKAASNAATTVNGQTCTLGSSCTIALSAVNPQTATYQVLAGDFSNYKTITAASGTFTVTLVASGSQPANGQYITIINYGSGAITIARSGQNINGGTASLTLAAGSATAPTSAKIYSDGTNYFAATAGQSGSTVTAGTFASLPGSPATNQTYMFSNSIYSNAWYDGAAWHYYRIGQEMTPPVSGNFSWQNQGTSTATTTNGGAVLDFQAGGNTTTNAVRAWYVAYPGSTPFTITAAMKFSSLFLNFNLGGLGISDGTKTEFINLGFANTAGSAPLYSILTCANSTCGSPAFVVAQTNLAYNPEMIWFRLADNGTNRIWSMSFDGVNFIQLLSEGRATFVTPTRIGIVANPESATDQILWVTSWLQQ